MKPRRLSLVCYSCAAGKGLPILTVGEIDFERHGENNTAYRPRPPVSFYERLDAGLPRLLSEQYPDLPVVEHPGWCVVAREPAAVE